MYVCVPYVYHMCPPRGQKIPQDWSYLTMVVSHHVGGYQESNLGPLKEQPISPVLFTFNYLEHSLL